MKYSVCKYIHQKEGFTISVSFGGNIVQKAVPVAVGVATTVGAGITTSTVVAVIAPVAVGAAIGYGAVKVIEKLKE